MDFSPRDCQNKQRTIYAENFYDALSSPDIRIESSVKGIDSGCLLVLRYDAIFCQHLEQTTEKLYGDIPRVRYDFSNFHTTILTGPKLSPKNQANEEELEYFQSMQKRLKEFLEPSSVASSASYETEKEQNTSELDQELENDVEAALEEIQQRHSPKESEPSTINLEGELDKMNFELQDLLVNTNSLIAASEASDEFWVFAHRLLEAMKSEAGWKMPWGSHITMARFLENGALLPQPKEAIGLGLLTAISEPKPISLELVWFECDEQGFRFV